MKLLMVLSDLNYGGAARQARMLALRLPGKIERQVCVLGRSGPWEKDIRAAAGCHAFNWKRLFDVRPCWRLRQLMRDFQPDVIHVWGLPALRWALLAAGRKRRPRIIVSRPFLGRDTHTQVGPLDRRLLGCADRVTASGAVEAARCRKIGVELERLTTIPPGVEIEAQGEPDRAAFLRELRIPINARLLMAAGPLEPSKGYLDAVWSFDIMRYLMDDLHLVLIGSGSAQARLAQFARDMESTSHVHFTGPRMDMPGLLGLADLVWAPGRERAGLNAPLEAMAAGKVVLGWRLPELAEIVLDGHTGILLPPGDKVALARQTSVLLDDVHRRRQLGESARQRVRTHFAADDVARRYAELYQQATTSPR